MTKSKIHWVSEFSGIQSRFEACFSGLAYAPHRHDTYTLALTTKGVQSFNYRGALRHSLPGNVVILHPDELHDGQAGNDAPFAYRAINFHPADIQEVLQGAPLPFVPNGISEDKKMQALAVRLLSHLDIQLQHYELEDALFEFSELLQELSGQPQQKCLPNYSAIKQAKEYLDFAIDQDVCLDRLSEEVNYSKWQLSRDFKTLYGTSPYRYLMLRRLQKAKLLVMHGTPITQVALMCNFADQAHFTRHFKSTFGLTPKKWQTYSQAS